MTIAFIARALLDALADAPWLGFAWQALCIAPAFLIPRYVDRSTR